ncbi:MAG TPA: ATP-binding protein [Archangium sp.]|uniref:sensor histidine kinase n=1 Tax=Archangium sp. TaxID=1872627 RepID=UPI002E2FB096|nr:ATP-binding protein [Archangium sp.]HEX5753309.1 ATP-binding protein [Archangium sp.]
MRKAVAGFLFVALLAILLGASSLAVLRSAMRSQDQLLTGYMEDVVLTQELVTAHTHFMHQASDFLLQEDEGHLDALLQARENFGTVVGQLTRQQPRTPEERQLVAHFVETRDRARAVMDHLIATRREEGPASGPRLLAELQPVRMEMEKTLNALADHERERYWQTRHQTREASSRALGMLALGFLGTVVVAVALGVFLVRALRQRVRAESERAAMLEREHAAHRAVEERQALLDLVIEQSGDAVVVTDAKGVIRLFNAEAERQHGVTRQQVSAPEWADTFGLLTLDGHPLPLEETPLYRALQGRPVNNARWLVKRPDGSVRTLCGTASPLRRPDGSHVGAVLTARDETERLALEQQRANALERLRSTAEFRERFLGIVGHDLRNPLNAITLSARVLLVSEALPERELKAVRRIASSADRMARMISELLDFTRSRLGGGMPVDPCLADLSVICREALEELETSHPGSRLSLRVLGQGLGEWDAGRLSQVVSNLVGNALQYSPEGSPIRVTVDGRASHEVVLSVHNEGAPIPGDVLPELFEPFRRGTRENAHHGGGLGLGLYIVQQIILAHGGTLGAESHAGDGTTFTARLPRENPDRAVTLAN